MPKLATSDAERHKRLCTAIVVSGMISENVSYGDLAKVLGKTERAVRNNVKNVDRLPVEELRTIAKVLKLTDAQVLDIVGGKKK